MASDNRAPTALARAAGMTPEQLVAAMNEVANIVASACLSAIGQLTRLKLLPSVPTLLRDTAANVVEEVVNGGAGQRMMMLEARFNMRHSPAITGQLLVLPDAPSLRELLSRLGV